MTLRLKGSNSGDVSLKAPATAGNNTITLPTSNGSAEQFLKNSGTAGELEFSNMVETSTGTGIGTSSPQKFVHVSGAGSSDVVTARIQQSTNNTSTDGGALLELGGTRSDGTYGFYGGIKGGRRNSASDNKGYLAFFSDNNDGQSLAERMRLDDAGRLLLGDTSDSSDSLLIVQGNAGDSGTGGQISIQRGGSANPTSPSDLGNIAFKDSAASRGAVIGAVCDGDWASNDFPTRLEFKVTADGDSSPIERIRIKSDGNTLMRSSTSNGVLNLNSTQSASESSNALVVQHSATSITGGTAACIIFTNGNIKNSNNFYGSLSDAKLKENIVDASSQWDDIKAIQVRNYNFKESTGQQTHRQLGVVAQELETVSPGLVSDSPDRDEEGNDLGTVTKSVNYSVLYMKAVKALQEAQTRIETLETQNTAQQTQIDDLLTRVTALEAA